MARNNLPKADRAPSADARVPIEPKPGVEEFRRFQLRTMPPGVREKWLSAEPPRTAEDEFFDTLPPNQPLPPSPPPPEAAENASGSALTDPTLITRRSRRRAPGQIALAILALAAALIAAIVALRSTSQQRAQASEPQRIQQHAAAQASVAPKRAAPSRPADATPAKTSEKPILNRPSRVTPAPVAPAAPRTQQRAARPLPAPSATSSGVDTKTPFF